MESITVLPEGERPPCRGRPRRSLAQGFDPADVPADPFVCFRLTDNSLGGTFRHR